ncbi:MAG: outer membrane lipoprotein carrier protein LolA [Planctomycetes bacterium]|nr:outer membrane lipoprotein carrier protein LolA [Planctomycetota bacterium]
MQGSPKIRNEPNLNKFLILILCLPSSVFIGGVLCGACTAQPANQAPAAVVKPAEPNVVVADASLEPLLQKINEAAKTIQSCRASVDYLVIQEPELLNSQTRRKGTLYYQKADKGSKLRLNFDSIKQDDAGEQKKTEQYFFDGVWLTKIDYAQRQIDQYQQAPVDKPVEVFDYISHHFPIVGFTGSDILYKQFIIQQIPPAAQEKQIHHLLLKVKPDSVYKDDYTQIDLWIDGKTYLPLRMVSLTIQGDTYDIRLSKMELNKTIPAKTFEIETPADFSKNVRTLEQKPQGKDSQWPQDL